MPLRYAFFNHPIQYDLYLYISKKDTHDKLDHEGVNDIFIFIFVNVFIFILLRKWDTYGEFNHERVNNTSDHSEEVKSIPVVFEVALEKKGKCEKLTFLHC